MNELLVIEHKGNLVADSREVAKAVGKRHDHLIRDIEKYIDHLTSPNLGALDFFLKATYKDDKGEKRPMYYLTRKGCDMVANKMTGAKGTVFTAMYINRFYEMEEALKARQSARLEHPQFTDTIKRIHEEPRPYHFSNESDLINRLVLGMTAKQYKEAMGIPKSEKSIRSYLPPEDIKLVDLLQKADIGLMISERDFGKRKMLLEWYLQTLRPTKAITTTVERQTP